MTLCHNMHLKEHILLSLMKVCLDCREEKYIRDFEWGEKVCRHCQTHRLCTRCCVKRHIDNFGKNSNDDFLLMCNDCQSKSRRQTKQKNETVRALSREKQYVECEICGGRYHKLNEGKSRHQKKWTCVKSTMSGNPGKKEYCEWLVANEHNPDLLKNYLKSIPEAKRYLKNKRTNMIVG